MTVWKQIQISVIYKIHLLVDSKDRTYLRKVDNKIITNSKYEKLSIKIDQEINSSKHIQSLCKS